jgi:low affinity Fe/Cu permease
MFTRFASTTSRAAGEAATFVIALGLVLAWAVTGPLFGFSESWQLVINTGTTIVTFLMVFLIQNTQTRGEEAVQIKLDELIQAHRSADSRLLDLEELDERELRRIQGEYRTKAKAARRKRTARGRKKG